MQLRDFHYDLPAELIAQQPLADRSASRLLLIDGARDVLADRQFRDLPELLSPGDLLVFNDTRVIPARLTGHKAATGGQVEVLVERILADGYRALCLVRSSKPPRTGTVLVLEGGVIEAVVVGRSGEFFEIDFGDSEPLLARLDRWGHVPLPPYIERADTVADRARYQTVMAEKPGAVAAPTAGLHFDDTLLSRLRETGIRIARVTLHVGAGTFQPVRMDDIRAHQMHAERAQIDDEVVQAIADTRARGGRVIAVGTTVVRSLETAAIGDGQVRTFAGETRLFLIPGSRFRVVDGLVTNFHLPESTLLMLVCAFAGHAQVMQAYRHAVETGYRFFSYGDACLVWPAAESRAS